MISFEYTKGDSAAAPLPEELEIYLDAAGLRLLQSILKSLGDGRTEHQHLFSESWGGSELLDETIAEGAIPIKHVKIYVIPS